jgi:hypothetical protein
VVVISASCSWGRRRIYGGTGPGRVVGGNGLGVLLKEDMGGLSPPEVHDGIVARADDADRERAEAGGRLLDGPSPGYREVAFVPQATQQTETFSLKRSK